MRLEKPSRKLIIVVTSILLLCVLWKWYDHEETRRWKIEIRKTTPIYELKEYPYGTESGPNKIVEYLQPGQKPEILDVWHGYDWIYFEVRLPDGRRGYVFDDDVEASRGR